MLKDAELYIIFVSIELDHRLVTSTVKLRLTKSKMLPREKAVKMAESSVVVQGGCQNDDRGQRGRAAKQVELK